MGHRKGARGQERRSKGRCSDGGGGGEGEDGGEKEHLRPEGDNVVKMTGGGGEVPAASSQSSASYDMGARSAAALAKVWKGNPSQSHHYTSCLGGVE